MLLRTSPSDIPHLKPLWKIPAPSDVLKRDVYFPLLHAVLHTFKASTAAEARMSVELHSREVLVVWVAFCMLHAAASKEHPILQQYGVGLCWEDLRHLVLSDRTASSAALEAVAAYLQHHTRPGRAVFTLSDGGQATFSMAAQYAQSDADLRGIWLHENVEAEQRKEAHWLKVLEKKQLAAELRAKLVQEEAVEAAAQLAYNEAVARRAALPGNLYRTSKRGYVSYYHHDCGVSECQRKLHAAQAACSSTRAALQQALVPPAPIIQPLPQVPEASHAWVFFLYMPHMLRYVPRYEVLPMSLLVSNCGHTAPAWQAGPVIYKNIGTQNARLQLCFTTLARHSLGRHDVCIDYLLLLTKCISMLCRQLSRASFLAQQLLLPRLHSVHSLLQEHAPRTLMQQHYNAHSNRNGSGGRVKLISDVAVPSPNEVRPYFSTCSCSMEVTIECRCQLKV
jgi:hypothetical protein